MSLRFRGGERLQRGRGIGGLLRLAKSLFFPVVKSIGKTAVKAANSKVGKQAIKAIKEQAIDSAVNLTSDLIAGKDMGEGIQREMGVAREKTAEFVGNIKKTNKSAKTRKPKQKILKKVNASKIGSRKYRDTKYQDIFNDE